MAFFDIFKRLFGGSPDKPAAPLRAGEDVYHPATLSVAEALVGATLQIELKNPDGTRREIVQVRVPAGAQDGMKLRIPGKGKPGTAGNGDLYVVLNVTGAASLTAPAQSGFPTAPTGWTVTTRMATPPSMRPPPPRPAPPAPPRPPEKPKVQTLNLDASAFAPLAGSQIQSQLKGLGSDSRSIFRGMADTDNRFWGDRSVIPPSSDPRTRFIDRGMVGQGMITPEELVEIHQVGDQMLEMRGELDDAHRIAAQAVERSKQEREALKKQKKAQAEERRQKHAAAVAQRKATDIIYLGRGVSRGLSDRRANVEKLQAGGLPVLATPADVAAAMGISIPQLRWLAFHSEAATRTHYVRFSVPKKSGGTRELAAPHRRIRAAQEWILAQILEKIAAHPAAHGFVKGRSTRTNAGAHVSSPVVINCDLRDFFPSITVHRVMGMFIDLGYSPAAATILALVCTESPRRVVDYAGTAFHVATGPRCLPQGACTSPAISNLITRRLDSRLAGISRKLGFAYTRYADDISFSGTAVGTAQPPPAKDSPEHPTRKVGYLLARCRHIAGDEGFAINEDKTRVQRPHTSQRVTGLVVNTANPGVPRKTIRRLRAILCNAQKTGLAAQNTRHHPHFDSHIRGMIAYIHMVNPAQAEKLRTALAKVAP